MTRVKDGSHRGFRGMPPEHWNIPAFRIIHGAVSSLKRLLGCRVIRETGLPFFYAKKLMK